MPAGCRLCVHPALCKESRGKTFESLCVEKERGCNPAACCLIVSGDARAGKVCSWVCVNGRAFRKHGTEPRKCFGQSPLSGAALPRGAVLLECICCFAFIFFLELLHCAEKRLKWHTCLRALKPVSLRRTCIVVLVRKSASFAHRQKLVL